MRSDMAKVVTEAPRRGHGASSLKTAYTLRKDEYDADDHGSTRAPCSMHDKSFSDVLGPLRGYLRKQIGRPWNNVYSEMCRHLDKRSLTGRHIWTHVYQEVEVHAQMHNGVPYVKPRYGSFGPVAGLYVHPLTGLLCETPKPRRRRYPKKNPDVISLNPTEQLERLRGIWYHVTLQEEPVYRWVTRRIHPFDPLSPLDVFHVRTGAVTKVVVRKRQLNSKELKTRGLRNAA